MYGGDPGRRSISAATAREQSGSVTGRVWRRFRWSVPWLKRTHRSATWGFYREARLATVRANFPHRLRPPWRNFEATLVRKFRTSIFSPFALGGVPSPVAIVSGTRDWGWNGLILPLRRSRAPGASCLEGSAPRVRVAQCPLSQKNADEIGSVLSTSVDDPELTRQPVGRSGNRHWG